MEGGRLPTTKGTILQAVQGPAQRNATSTDATNDAKHDVRCSTKPNEQYATDYTDEPMIATGKQGVLTIWGEG